LYLMRHLYDQHTDTVESAQNVESWGYQGLFQQLKLSLPPQPPARIATGRPPSHPL
jgi:hypothetical protein